MNRKFVSSLILLGGSIACGAQSGRPITSLPKSPGDAPATTPVAAQPDTSVPATATSPDAAPAYVPPAASAPIPSMGSEVLTSQPVAAAPATSAPAPAPVNLAPQQPVPQPVAPVETVSPAPIPPSPATPDLGPAPLRASMLATPAQETPVVRRKPHFGPGSAIAVQLKGGFAGAGIDIATPLAQRLNLRAGASFFQYSGSYDIDGIHIDGEAKFRSATVQLDIFPFGGGFRISPGLTVYNGNNLNASALAAIGTQVDLGDDTFVSGCDNVTIPCSTAKDPIHGTASMTFGDRTAPSLTIGWGNMIPRSNRHISFPFEIGVQYIKDPQIHLNLAGTACGTTSSGSGCQSVQTAPDIQQDIRDEENSINNTIRPLRFYPILSFGVAWAFHIGQH